MTKPSLIQTSIVVKSIEARQSQWVFRKVDQLVWRFLSGAGSIPCAFKMLLMLLARRDPISEVLQGALNTLVAPSRVLLGHANHQIYECFSEPGSSNLLASIAVVPLFGNHRRIVSGQAMCAICRSSLRPRILPLTAKRRR